MDLMHSKRNLSILTILVLTAGVVAATPALAATNGNRGMNRADVASSSIRIGELKGGPGERKDRGNGPASSTAPAITGNGQPVVAGTVSAISGTTMTVSTKSGITYAVDVSSAKIVKGKATITISDVAVNDTVVVQGATNGTSVTASSVIDEANAGIGNATSTAARSGSHGVGNFFGQVGKFFKSLFGF